MLRDGLSGFSEGVFGKIWLTLKPIVRSGGTPPQAPGALWAHPSPPSGTPGAQRFAVFSQMYSRCTQGALSGSTGEGGMRICGIARANARCG